jgi:UDP-N-acetylglucosamine 2-epimerase
MRSKNIIDVTHDKNKILELLKKMQNNKFYKKLIKNLRNPYSQPNTSVKILRVLKKINLDQKELQKTITY